DLRWIPLLPPRAGRTVVPRGDGPQAGSPTLVRLSPGEQVDGRLGRRGACPLPGQGVPGSGDDPRSGREDGRPGRMEKHILREAFEDLLPASVAWRQKEQFSDGVGYNWIDSLKAYAEEQVSDREMENAVYRFPHNTPDTKEAYFYRAIFDEHFPLQACAETVPGGKSVACSTPEALAWDSELSAITDPSGRSVRGVHASAY